MKRILIIAVSVLSLSHVSVANPLDPVVPQTAVTVLQEARDHLLVLPDKSLQLLVTHQPLISSDDPNLRIDWYISQMTAAIRAAQSDALLQALHQLAALPATDYTHQQFSAILNGVGVYLRRNGFLQQAKASYVCGMAFNTSELQSLRSLVNLGIVERHLGNPAQAEKFYLAARELAVEQENQLMIAVIENNLGVLALVAKQYPAARNYFSRALELNQQLDRRSGELLSSLNLLLTFLYQQDHGYFERLHLRVKRKLKLSPDSARGAYFRVLMHIYQAQLKPPSQPLNLTELPQDFAQIDDAGIQALVSPLLSPLGFSPAPAQAKPNKHYQGSLLSQFGMCDWQKYSTDPEQAVVKSVLLNVHPSQR